MHTKEYIIEWSVLISIISLFVVGVTAWKTYGSSVDYCNKYKEALKPYEVRHQVGCEVKYKGVWINAHEVSDKDKRIEELESEIRMKDIDNG